MPQVHVTILNKTGDTIKVFSPNMAKDGFFEMGADLTFPFPDLTNGFIYLRDDRRLQVLPGDDGKSIKVVDLPTGKSEVYSYDPNQVADIFVQVDKDWSFSIRKADYPFTWYPFLVKMTVNDADFKPILGDTKKNPPIAPGQLTPATSTYNYQPGNPVVVVPGAPGAPDVVQISGPVDIQYRVVANAGSSYKYRPLGLALQGRNGNADPDGWDIFDNVRVGPETLTVRDNFARVGNPGKKRYEYYVMVQRSDGALGIIDPEIENEY